MKKFLTIFILLIFSTSLYAENYSEMSTQELIAIIGYVKPKNQKKFYKELNGRVPSMSAKEKKEYEKNLKRKKSK